MLLDPRCSLFVGGRGASGQGLTGQTLTVPAAAAAVCSDGEHEWHRDGFSFLLTDKMLRVDGMDCHFAGALSPSLLIHLIKAEGGAAE